MELIKGSLISFSIFFIVSVSHAEVVKIDTDKSVGQGYLYPFEDKCMLATPKHVIEGARAITLLTATRETFQASIAPSYNVDMAKLSTNVPFWQCQNSKLELKPSLSTLLTVYGEGVLKTMIGDGSLQNVPHWQKVKDRWSG